MAKSAAQKYNSIVAREEAQSLARAKDARDAERKVLALAASRAKAAAKAAEKKMECDQALSFIAKNPELGSLALRMAQSKGIPVKKRSAQLNTLLERAGIVAKSEPKPKASMASAVAGALAKSPMWRILAGPAILLAVALAAHFIQSDAPAPAPAARIVNAASMIPTRSAPSEADNALQEVRDRKAANVVKTD